MEDILKNRWMLKAKFAMLKKAELQSDQMKGVGSPHHFKEAYTASSHISLPVPSIAILKDDSLFSSIQKRESNRKYSSASFSLEELSYLLWASQGIRKPSTKPGQYFRNVPSAGCRHAFETYIATHRVEGLKKGIYHYLPLDHSLELLFEDNDSENALSSIALGQSFVGNCAVTFLWSCIPYRMEWRYSIESTKLILLDAGHLCQNLSLAAVSIHAGSCAIGAYDQESADAYLGLDGEDEFVVYMASTGKLP